MTTRPADEYVLGTDARELDRLGLQHRLWADVAREQWRRAGFGAGQTLLDLGCGPGFATRELAQLAGPSGRVIACDLSLEFLAHVAAQPALPGAAPIETQAVDAQHLGIERIVDGAYARWVLSFVPETEAVLAGLADAVVPGGAVAIQDYVWWSHLFWAPRGPQARDLLVRGISASYDAVRADPHVGQRLPGLLRQHGFDVVEIRPLVRIMRPGDAMWAWPSSFFESYLPRVVAAGHLSESERLEIVAEWDRLSADEDAFFWTPPQVEIVARRR